MIELALLQCRKRKAIHFWAGSGRHALKGTRPPHSISGCGKRLVLDGVGLCCHVSFQGLFQHDPCPKNISMASDPVADGGR
jgi:hypothetical protein